MQTSEKALPIGSETQLFVDDEIVNAKRGVVRTLHPASKLDKPVLTPDRPWEGQRVYIYGSVCYDPNAQRASSEQRRVQPPFRMWYLTRLGRGQQYRAPGLRERPGDMILYATSEDGVHWEKPNLGRHEFDGSRDNNILFFDKHSPTVIIDADAAPDQRYKMASWNWEREKYGYWVAHSADGLTWNEYSVNPILMNTDERGAQSAPAGRDILEAVTVARNPRTGEYFAFHRRWGDVGGHTRRLIAVATSPDFLAWSSHDLILVPDEQDDAWIQDSEQRTEFYCMSGFVYGRQFLGFLPVFDVVRDAREEEGISLGRPTSISKSGIEIDRAPWDGPIEVQLVHSRDGRKWERFEDRSPIIPRGEPGSFDAGCILCSADRPVIHNDEVWHYYTAINTTHGGPMPPKTVSIARAAWRLDGFVSLDAGHFGGVVETVPLEPSGERLEVNVDASVGSLVVEALSASGETQPGYSYQDCQAIHVDNVRQTVRWNGNDRLPAGQPLRLRFHLQDAQLYSFRIQE